MSERSWWQESQRMVQTNLREIDADLDLDRYFAELLDLKTTVLLFNTGGIVANYPTQLPCHYLNPHLPDGRDLVGQVLERCHEHGVRYLARFDFSKANRLFYSEHPDWFYRKADNSVVDYNGQLHTCVHGPYQRHRALEIAAEVLERYPIDGMFFNMFGYQTTDYSRNDHGLCHCGGCRAAFRQFSGHEIPSEEDPHDPVYQEHRRFRREAARAMRRRLVQLAREKRGDELLIAGDNLVRREANTSLYRSLPRWVYRSSDQVKQIVDAQDGRAVANAAVHFVDFPYRHTAVPPPQTALRLAQNLAHGGWLDFYCIGPLERQEDRACFAQLREIYHYHHTHAEAHYTGLQPAATIALLGTGGEEYRGLYRILAESHRPFAVLTPAVLAAGEPASRLAAFELVIVPNADRLPPALDAAVDAYVAGGGRLLTTGRLPVTPRSERPIDGEGTVRLQSLGTEAVTEHRQGIRSAKLQVRDHQTFAHVGDDVELILVDHFYQFSAQRPQADGHLQLVPPCMFGPPEKCYYDEVSDAAGLVTHTYGSGMTAAIPWPLGRIYYELSLPPHRQLVLDVIDHILETPTQLITAASPMVEVALHRQEGHEGRLLVHLVNSSGHHGTAFHPPVPMADVTVSVRRHDPVEQVYGVRHGRQLSWSEQDGYCTFTLPTLSLFEAVVIE